MLITTICPACGGEFKVKPNRLLRDQPNPPCCSRSCAASIRTRQSKHGHCIPEGKSKEFRAWRNMKARCTLECVDRFTRYGGRGITVCERWQNSFENFLGDVGSAPSPTHTLGRIDNNGNYEPGNVEWQTVKEQSNNRETSRLITAFDKTQTLQQWADETGVQYQTILARIDRYGWKPEDALTIPSLFKGHNGPTLLTFKGKTQSIAAWSRETGIPASAIQARITRYKWTVERALTTDHLSYHKRH